jgi:CubicO group peptidase (beta-lactamase class C family)
MMPTYIRRHRPVLVLILLLQTLTAAFALTPQDRTSPSARATTASKTKSSTSRTVPRTSFAPIDAAINKAVQDGQIPGAVLLIGHKGKVVYRKAYGQRWLEPKREPMTLDTVFDMASLTKVIATTSSVMRLFEQGQIRLNDTVAKYIPE